jgi:hypothetical protein
MECYTVLCSMIISPQCLDHKADLAKPLPRSMRQCVRYKSLYCQISSPANFALFVVRPLLFRNDTVVTLLSAYSEEGSVTIRLDVPRRSIVVSGL